MLERSKSDVLILLDCCAGAASATFPSGTSITETISASSWDAIAPDPGRYSFTNALIEVLQEWRVRTFSAAMLHAEVLARLKHPRPITINGKLFEARSTPVHFMMTSNHKAPSIELSRSIPEDQLPPSPQEAFPPSAQNGRGYPDMGRDIGRAANGGPATNNDSINTEPNEDTPHVMISLALEDDQKLDINAWEQWIGAFPALAKYVKVQGVFKSHSTLLLVSMPVTIWDMLPEDHATSFVAFIRSNNLAAQKPQAAPLPIAVRGYSQQHESTAADSASFISGVSGTTFTPTENLGLTGQMRGSLQTTGYGRSTATLPGSSRGAHLAPVPRSQPSSPPQILPMRSIRSMNSATSLPALQRQHSSTSLGTSAGHMTRQMIINQQQAMRRTTFGDHVPEPKKFSAHVERRLEEYYHHEPLPNDGQKAFFASNLGVEPWHIEVWFHHRRERDAFAQRFASLKVEEATQQIANGPRMILPADLNELLNISRSDQILLFDLRVQKYYQRSHIRGAINLRAPQSFLRAAALDMIERAFTDEESRKTFTNWKNARCVVLYARGLDSLLECPSAMALLEKLRADGWTGQCFILKGHYREFSESFEKHILKDSSASESDESIEKTATTSTQESSHEEEYAELMARLDKEDHLAYLGTSPSQLNERTAALRDEEAELEVEFKNRFSDLYKKAQEVHRSRADDADTFVTKAQMVEYLDRGLTKIRDAQSAPPEQPVYEPGHSKLADDSYFNRTYVEREADDYVDVGRGEEQGSGDAGKGKETRTAMSPDEVPRRGRGGILNKVFRRT